jgi:hypothetical protein
MTSSHIGICKLCLTNLELRRSHILSEFLYKHTYDDHHRHAAVKSRQIHVTEKSRGMTYMQNGVREYLLCSNCETQLSRYEKYASELLDSIEILSTSKPGGLESIVIPNVDYKLFKLFQLSILWRASISKDEMFADVFLGPYEEIIRNMILNNNPGKPYEFGCTLYSSEGTKSLKTLIWPPRRFRFAGITCYHFLIFGFEWIYIISKRFTKLPLMESLREDGSLEIFITPITREEFETELHDRFHRIGKYSY